MLLIFNYILINKKKEERKKNFAELDQEFIPYLGIFFHCEYEFFINLILLK